MKSTLAILVSALLLTGVVSASAQTMTPQQYHKEKGPCACPNDKDRAGRTCGKRSAFCQKGGVEVTGCYRVDVARRTREACG